MNKKLCIVILMGCFLLPLKGQESTTVFNFLKLPVSAHAAALGGENISVIDDDITLSLHNPALLSSIGGHTLNLGYMTYMSGSKVAGAAYGTPLGERSTGALAVRYVDYGSFDGYTQDNVSTGSFNAMDFSLNVLYSYLLSDSWSGGVTGKMIYSKYDTYSSFAMGVDLGLNYYDGDHDFSYSIAVRNLGGQLKTFDETRERMPLNLVTGFSKSLAHAPFRFSFTLDNLTRWSSDDFYNADGKKDNFGELFLKHCIFGIDYKPSDNFYLSAGYNYRMNRELSVSGSRWEGFTAGAGLTVKRVKVGLSYSKLHLSSSSFLFNLSLNL